MIRDLSRVTPAFRIKKKDSKEKNGGVGREGGKKHTIYAEQKKRHRCIEQSFRLCGRR